MSTAIQQLRTNGFALIAGVYNVEEMNEAIEAIQSSIENDCSSNIKSSRGETYAARNLIDCFPGCTTIYKKQKLIEVLSGELGPQFGLVRVLYFDKHPDRTWTLPWHKDMTIAVKDSSLPSQRFRKPTTKSGICHVEAPVEILERMLTLRIRLDAVTDDNGPLEVIPGSHLDGKTPGASDRIHKQLSNPGDVFAMKPLLTHSSGSSNPGTIQHRRILHLEFAADEVLPDNYQWNHFISHQNGPHKFQNCS